MRSISYISRIKMNKPLYFVLAIILISISCGSCKQKSLRNKRGTSNEVVKVTINNKSVNCYSEKLKWLINKSTFIDTIVYFRNFIENDSSMRVSCILKDLDPDCEALIFNDKHIRATIEALNRIHRYFIMSYEEQHPAIILSLYVIDKETSETVEHTRYQIINNEITGINILPYIINEFRPYDEFRKFRPVEM
jgi:hypothetical protein